MEDGGENALKLLEMNIGDFYSSGKIFRELCRSYLLE